MNIKKITPKIPKSNDHDNDYSKEFISKRSNFIKEFNNANVSNINNFSIDPLEMKGNIENVIGCIQLPVGIAGPLKINGEHAQGEFLLPFATTEGVLLTGLHNGSKLISSVGGAKTKVLKDHIHVSPIFLVNGLDKMNEFIKWIEDNKQLVQTEVETSTKHGKLISIETKITGVGVQLTLFFTTGDAAGLNMIVLATFKICKLITDKLNVRFYFRSNYSSDKKNSSFNFIRGYGKEVYAEAVVPKSFFIDKNLGVSVEQFIEYINIAYTCSTLAGMNGQNFHVQNIVSGILLATGQDIGHAIHCSSAITTMQMIDDGDLHISVTIPNLVIGTVGGGTGLPTQKESLQILECDGKDKSLKFAEIIAAAALAGELSIAISLANFSHVSGHEKFGRNKPKE